MSSGAVPIVTPCHGTPLRILTETVGHGHMSHDEPSEVVCEEPGCYNSWTPSGEPAGYNR